MRKTTKEEFEIVKQYIKQLKKLNSEGKIKILETDSKIDLADKDSIDNLGESVKGTFIDVALYVYN